MEKQFWAVRGHIKLGPFPSREEAVEAFRAAYPKPGKKGDIMTGYGSAGPYFDIMWHSGMPEKEGE